MKLDDIEINCEYTDGKGGKRRILSFTEDRFGTPYIHYQLISGRKNGSPRLEGGVEYFATSVSSFQRWAKAKA